MLGMMTSHKKVITKNHFTKIVICVEEIIRTFNPFKFSCCQLEIRQKYKSEEPYLEYRGGEGARQVMRKMQSQIYQLSPVC